jgi:hypothetical protein
MADTIKVYFFKENGKYYCEEDVPMLYAEDGYPPDYFRACLKNYLQGKRLNDMTAVAIEINHKLSYPMMVKVKNL